MLRIIQSSSASGAKSYYSSADYYTDEQELVGTWHGKAAARLGLFGTIRQSDWRSMCDNRRPHDGTALTPRDRCERRIGYDFNFHVPKSVSLLYAMSGDDRLVSAFKDAVRDTMKDIESEMQTRVRDRGRNEDRFTSNMAWGEFIHFTARPVGGIPDPHLHAHCFVFNATWDTQEDRWKAGQFAGLKRDAPFFEAIFHSRLARSLHEIGVPVVRTAKGWEIEGISRSALQKFSRRTEVIEEAARKAQIVAPDIKGSLGARTRESKTRHLTFDELKEHWGSRLTGDERSTLQEIASRIGGAAVPEQIEAAKKAVEHSVSHHFERSAVVPERRLLAYALKRSVGVASPRTVLDNMSRQHLIIVVRDGRSLATTREVLDEESRMLSFAREGRGTCRPLAPDHKISRDWLIDAQRLAVRHVLNSRDRVTLVRGAAGTGKTSMMQEAVEGIQATGKRVFTFAPSADASRGVLRKEGFAEADTVSRLLIDEKIQTEVRGQVIWIDEAGLLSSRTMAAVFRLADSTGSRVVLSGDRHQHGSVERGAALRQLEVEAGIRPAELRDIQRQRGEYKEAVTAISEGRIEDGFNRLDRLGWIREVADSDRYQLLAYDYTNIVAQGKTALVVSPTHSEGARITSEIRQRFRASRRLKGPEHMIEVLENANFTEAERRDDLNYSVGDVLVFHQNASGRKKGDRVVVGTAPPPLDQASRFHVFHRSEVPFAMGDRVRITRNGTTLDGKHRLTNGSQYAISRFDANGNIVLDNGWVIARDYGHLAHGYCTTSYASQGKTIQHVLIGQSSASFPASSREQFYVSTSRGREQVTVYTDDRRALLDAVSKSDDRITAHELINGSAPNARVHSIELTPSRAREREEIAHER